MHEEYLNHFTKELSEEIKTYAIDDVLKSSRYIFTSRKGKQQWGYCTHCKEKFKTEGLKHNMTSSCPKCESECKVRASGVSRKYLSDSGYFVYYEKSIIDPDVIVARGIYVSRNYSGDYKYVKTNYNVRALYIFKIGNPVMLTSGYYTSTGFSNADKVYSLENNWYNPLSVKVKIAKESVEKAIESTPFQYSMWEEFRHFTTSDMVKYFDLFCKYPLIEQLTKLGFGDIVKAKLEGGKTYGAISWNAKNVFKMLRLNKGKVKELRNSGFKLNAILLRIYQMNIKDKSKLSLEEVQQISTSYGAQYKDLQGVLKYTTLRKANGYLKRQFKSNPSRAFYSRIQELTTWRDYIEDCEQLELDLSSDKALFPKDLYKAHDNTTKQIKMEGNALLDRMIKKSSAKLEKYIFQYKDLIIRPAISSSELIKEGSSLGHCVATRYTDKYAKGKTGILFIRKISKPDKPYFTVEIKNNTIIQCQGKNLIYSNDEIKEFIAEFKKEKLNAKKTKKETKLAV